MAPSRGLRTVQQYAWRSFRSLHRLDSFNRRYATAPSASDFAQVVAEPSSQLQIFVSRSLDPYVNLSIEHYLLQRSPAESRVLFLYTNRPCIVIGRNQNPWLEANLRLLHGGATASDAGSRTVSGVSLVRRRSGGGAVFHDEGNVNYSVICPTAEFNRDKHAEMVVRALRKLGVDRARVNERHDIVLDQGTHRVDVELGDYHTSAYTVAAGREELVPLKVSGSAYKLTRLRALHHGTCLLSSRNLNAISQYLRSPARPYIKARGVESVSSPVGNIGLENNEFEEAVISEFANLYGLEHSSNFPHLTTLERGDGWVRGIVDDRQCDITEINRGVAELKVGLHESDIQRSTYRLTRQLSKSKEWIYLQTPQFTFASHVSEEDDRERPMLPKDLPASVSC
ncbi:MAG: Biotin/lipoate A/B protein ligase [Sclerophora amabilis]|nr:MAG: Biotin/lipoate A/B protein ligase [Sclerophora amabilis]